MIAGCCCLVIPLSSSSSGSIFGVWQLYLALVLVYGFGYPIGHTALVGCFSKIVKKGPQGALMGYFASSGAVSRVIFPLLAGLLSDAYGSDSFIFCLMATILTGASILLAVKYKDVQIVASSN